MINMTRKTRKNKKRIRRKRQRQTKGGRKIIVTDTFLSNILKRGASRQPNTDGAYEISVQQIDDNSVQKVRRLIRETDQMLERIINRSNDPPTYKNVTTYEHNPVDEEFQEKLNEIITLSRDRAILIDTQKRNALTRKIDIMKNKLQNLIKSTDDVEIKGNLQQYLKTISII